MAVPNVIFPLISLFTASDPSIGILPRRILVHEDDAQEARELLTQAGLSHELRGDD